jgi:transcriptional regulator with XRE-family HTH domain
MYSVINRRNSQLGERKLRSALARNSSSRLDSTRKDVVTRTGDPVWFVGPLTCWDFRFLSCGTSSSVDAMQRQLQVRKQSSREATSQFPRNRHSVAAWMAELDRQRGGRIRDLREAHAWTQRQLADRLGVDPKTVHNWEAGKDINPTNLRELADLMDVTPEYVRYGEREETPDLGRVLNGHSEPELAVEMAAIRVEIAALSTQLEVLQRTLERSSGSGSGSNRSRRAK